MIDIDIRGYGYDLDTYYTVLDEEALTADMKKRMENLSNGQYEVSVEIITLDPKNYAKLYKIAGISVGGNILLNHYEYNDYGHMREIIPYSFERSDIELLQADGESCIRRVDGFLLKEQIPEELFQVNTRQLRLIVPEAETRGYTWFCEPKNESEYIQFARQITDQFFPTYTDNPYTEEGFSVRISRTDTYVKVLNIAIVLAEVIMYGFIILLLMIGLTSVISTLSTNVLTRAREFAVLKSVGMTSEGLWKMLLSESVFCTWDATMKGLPLGILIPLLINLSIRKIFPVVYEIPWLLLIMSVTIVFILILLITAGAINKLKNQNLNEAIRMETI